MTLFRLTAVLVAAILCGACGSNITCDEEHLYQRAREGMRVSAPDDLDGLQASRELTIPKASPREPRPEGSPCIDLPPTIQAAGSNE